MWVLGIEPGSSEKASAFNCFKFVILAFENGYLLKVVLIVFSHKHYKLGFCLWISLQLFQLADQSFRKTPRRHGFLRGFDFNLQHLLFQIQMQKCAFMPCGSSSLWF